MTCFATEQSSSCSRYCYLHRTKHGFGICCNNSSDANNSHVKELHSSSIMVKYKRNSNQFIYLQITIFFGEKGGEGVENYNSRLFVNQLHAVV